MNMPERASERTYTIVLEPAESGGYIVTVPALPELATQGRSVVEALANAREVIAVAIDERRARGEPIPDDVVPHLATVTVCH
jgi:antitoxin HicB